MNNWQSVFKDRMEYRAEIVKAVLEENHLNPVVVNKKFSAYDFGNFEVFVEPDHVIKAIKIINEDIKFE